MALTLLYSGPLNRRTVLTAAILGGVFASGSAVSSAPPDAGTARPPALAPSSQGRRPSCARAGRSLSHEPASLASGEVDLTQEVRDFVRLPEGRLGIRGTTRSLDSGSGCDVTSAWVKVLGPEGLETVREEDTHPPCP